MKKRMIALLAALGLLLAACGNGRSEGQEAAPTQTTGGGETLPFIAGENTRELTKEAGHLEAPQASYSDEQLTAVSELYVKLLAETAEKAGDGENVLISPTSLITALAMCENGAAGETLSQMEEVLGGIEVAQMNAVLYGMTQRLTGNKDVSWNVANSIWFKDDGQAKIKDEFVQKAASWYNAELWMAAFDDGTLNDINGWVSAHTKGMIPTILDDIPTDARMYLINALAFEGDWMEAYEEDKVVEDIGFTNADGSKTPVTMLCSEEKRYFESADGIGFLKDYKGGAYSFMGLLPEEGEELSAFVEKLGGEDLGRAIREAAYGDVIVNLPEFSFDGKYEMGGILKAMGMELAFDSKRADFSDMVEITEQYKGVYIGRVLHKTHIEVDRKGTRAAAASAVEMLDKAAAIEPEDPPVVIKLDRPFVYGIIDNETGLPVFLGVVNQM